MCNLNSTEISRTKSVWQENYLIECFILASNTGRENLIIFGTKGPSGRKIMSQSSMVVKVQISTLCQDNILKFSIF